jgi:hypothetical protein
MWVSRRESLKLMGAGIVMAPAFLKYARAASPPPRRLLVINSTATVTDALWRPLSAPGQPLQLRPAHAPLKDLLDRVVLVDGLTFSRNPLAGHGSPETLTGYAYDDQPWRKAESIDYWIGKRLPVSPTTRNMVVGWQANATTQYWDGGNSTITPIAAPATAWQTLFGSAGGSTDGQGAYPRAAVVDLVAAQVKRLSATVGLESRLRLQAHLDGLNQLAANLAMPSSLSPECGASAQSAIDSGQASNAANAAAVLAAHSALILSAFTCDATRVMALQIGESHSLPLLSPTTVNQHGLSHAYADSQANMDSLLACEVFQTQVFANIVNKLKATPDPLAPGSTLLDNTLVCWTRDISEPFSSHSQFNIPVILAGGTGYLNTRAGGAYYNYGGYDMWPGSDKIPKVSTEQVRGAPHQRLLLNLIAWMGIGQGATFGTVSALDANQRLALKEIAKI